MKRSKSYRASAEKISADTLYSPLAAVRLARETSTTKYDATVETVSYTHLDVYKRQLRARWGLKLR